jgi:cell wall-associated NlpC family hydrolase
MKWMIATMLVGSTTIGGAAIQNEGTESGNSAITHEARSTDPFTGTDLTIITIDPQTLLEEWDTLSPEQQAEWADVRDALLLEAELAHNKELRAKRIARLDRAIKAVTSRVGKTPYSFGGASVSGWDCSGLVMWTYDKLGIDVPHSATAQLYVGRHVAKPRKGDIVVWGGYHSGIYIGKGRVVNALNYYRDTNIIHVDDLGGGVTYVRAYNY